MTNVFLNWETFFGLGYVFFFFLFGLGDDGSACECVFGGCFLALREVGFLFVCFLLFGLKNFLTDICFEIGLFGLQDICLVCEMFAFDSGDVCWVCC